MRKNRTGKERTGPPKLRYRLLLYFITLLAGILSVAETKYGFFDSTADIVLYVIAALCLTAACCYLIQDIRGIKKRVVLLIQGNVLTNRIYSDYRYRTVLFTHFSFWLNIVYALSNGVLGIVNRSVWLGTLSVYYIFLSLMRSGIVRYDRRVAGEKLNRYIIIQELKVYRNTGILLTLITVALGGAVILLVNQEGGQSYYGYMIFVVAIYTFVKVIISVVNIFRVRKLKSPLLAAVRNIGYADALVSVLFLQTAMFASFGEDSSINQPAMNGATGACVCIMILAIGIYMIYSSARRIKRI